MPTAITDGKGGGSLAKVTRNRLQTEANIRPFMSFKAKGDASAFGFPGTITAGISAGNLIYNLRFTDDAGGFILARANISSDQPVNLGVYKTTGVAAGGDAITEAQLNFGSSVPSNVVARSAGGTGALTGLTEEYLVTEIRISAGQQAVFLTQEIPVIAPNTSLSLKIEAVNGTPPTRIAITLFGYESDLEL